MIKSVQKAAFLLLIFCSNICILFAQDYCIDGRFDNLSFSEEEISKLDNVVYGVADDRNGNAVELKMDIYAPADAVDPLPLRPCLLAVHGGGLNGGSKGNGLPVFLCSEFAERGYVAISIDYRLGWNQLSECGGDTASIELARYRAQQDVHAAIRFIKENAAAYRIDTGFIFLTGSSVGATMSMIAAYGQQSDFDAYVVDALGALDSSGNDFYYHTIDIKGMSGIGVGLPQPDILRRKNIPMLFFHGTCDFIIPYLSGPLFGCTSPLEYKTYYGSRYLSDVMWQEGTPYWLYTNERGDHGATDTLTILAESIPYFKDILCSSIETKETYEYHLNGCIVTNADTINLYIHPNPAEDQLHVEMHCGVSGLANYSILDLNGRVLAEGQADFKAPLGFFDIILPPATDPRSVYTLYVSLEEAKGYMHFMRR